MKRFLPLLTSLAVLTACAPTGTPAATSPATGAVTGGADPAPEHGPRPSDATPVSNGSAAGATGKPGRTLLAIYVVGSDLEDGDAGTNNFNEIVNAYKALTDEQKANVDVYVAFGGSTKAGWQGVNYVDIHGLLADAEKGVYGGNTGAYLSSDPAADMGKPETFKDFLTKVKERANGSAKVMVSLWNHGGSYDGYGFDSNTKSMLKLPEIKQALVDTDFHADIIGFDACLMAALEVAAIMKGHASYMLGSEETEPGHGWDYGPLVKVLGEKPEASLTEIGQTVIDGFITAAHHQSTQGKTLALLNLDNIDPVLAGLDDLVGSLDTNSATSYGPLLQAAAHATPYGVNKGRDDATSVDMIGMLNKLKADNPAAAPKADALIASIKNAVVYSREDGTKPDSNGLSLFTVENLGSLKSSTYNENNAATASWYGFLKKVLGEAGDSQAQPTIEEPTAETQGTRGGYRMHIKPAVALTEVKAVHGIKLASGKIEVVEEATEDEEATDGDFFLPSWDGKALFLVNGGTKVRLPLELIEHDPEASTEYVADVRYNGREATLHVILDDAAGSVDDLWITPNEQGPGGITLIVRDEEKLKAGDRLAIKTTTLDTETDEESTAFGPELTMAAAPTFVFEKVEGEAVFFTEATDLDGKNQNSTLEAVN